MHSPIFSSKRLLPTRTNSTASCNTVVSSASTLVAQEDFKSSPTRSLAKESWPIKALRQLAKSATKFTFKEAKEASDTLAVSKSVDASVDHFLLKSCSTAFELADQSHALPTVDRKRAMIEETARKLNEMEERWKAARERQDLFPDYEGEPTVRLVPGRPTSSDIQFPVCTAPLAPSTMESDDSSRSGSTSSFKICENPFFFYEGRRSSISSSICNDFSYLDEMIDQFPPGSRLDEMVFLPASDREGLDIRARAYNPRFGDHDLIR